MLRDDIIRREEEIRKAITISESYKKKLIKIINDIDTKYNNCEVDYFEYVALLNQVLGDKSLLGWLNYYDDYIKNYKKELDKLHKKPSKINVVSFVLLFFILSLVSLSIYFGFSSTGYIIDKNNFIISFDNPNTNLENLQTNLTENKTLLNDQDFYYENSTCKGGSCVIPNNTNI